MNSSTFALARAFTAARVRGAETLQALEELSLRGYSAEIGLAIQAVRASMMSQVDTTCRLIIEAEINAAGIPVSVADFEELIPTGSTDLVPLEFARIVALQITLKVAA